MNKKSTFKILASMIAILFLSQLAKAQCSWQTQLSDGFEYTSIVPDLIPGTTYQNTPQAYAVHTGAHSLYMNFVNYTGTTGTSAGTLVYSRTIPVCPQMPIRISLWLVTSFAGPQSNMHIKILDGNNTVLSNTDSVACPNVPNWVQYQSGSMTPITNSITFNMYTNVAGGNGNDLSVDDFLLERCASGTIHSTSPGFICTNIDSVNLMSIIPGSADTLGAWSGPSATSGGYLGTYFPSINTGGTYIYSSSPYGTSVGCPQVSDTVIVLELAPPSPNLGSDTTVCTNQFLVLNPHTSTSYTYLWSTSDVTPTVFVSSAVADTVNYTVHVTDNYGCANSDTVRVIYKVCTAVDEISGASLISVYPNPATNQLTIKLTDAAKKGYDFVLTDESGRVVMTTRIHDSLEQISLPNLNAGMYFFRLENNSKNEGQGKLIISGK